MYLILTIDGCEYLLLLGVLELVPFIEFALLLEALYLDRLCLDMCDHIRVRLQSLVDLLIPFSLRFSQVCKVLQIFSLSALCCLILLHNYTIC